MKEVKVTVFGSNAPMPSGGCSCGSGCCGPARTMQEEGEDLKNYLVEKYGDAVKYMYVDVQSEEMKNYPDIAAILNKVRLPLTVLNGEPRFHGGFSVTMIADAVGELVK